MRNKAALAGTHERVELKDLESVGAQLISQAEDLRIWTFIGDLGSGKTTLIRALCKLLRVQSTVRSPTFSLINEYANGSGETVYHADFYRLSEETEALETGIAEYMNTGNYCFIEWPAPVSELLPPAHVEVQIVVDPGNLRTISQYIHG